MEVRLFCSFSMASCKSHPSNPSLADLASFSSCEAFFGGGRGCWVLGQRWSSRRFRRARSTSVTQGERSLQGCEKQGTYRNFMFWKWLGVESWVITSTALWPLWDSIFSWMDATQIPQALPPWPLGPWTSKVVDRKAEMTPATLVVPIQAATYSQTCEYPAEVCTRSTRSSEQWNSLSLLNSFWSSLSL